MRSRRLLRFLEEKARESRGDLGHTWQICFWMGARGKSWDPAESALSRRCDRSGVERVLPEVQSVVDAGADDVRPSWDEARSGVERDVDAIRRRSIDREDAGFDGARAEGPMQAQRVTGRALLVLRSDGDDVGPIGERCRELTDPATRVSIVVRN